jgi:hypothetical protein
MDWSNKSDEIYFNHFLSRQDNQNHQLSWWYALCLKGNNTGNSIRVLKISSCALFSQAAAEAA